MRFLCPFCNSAISTDENTRGFRVQCSGCGKSILVPTGQFDAGCVIGDFAIRSKLGAGAIGSVYKAYQISLERIVALKILSKKYMTIRGVEEFMREARAAANLSHPNLVQSYAVGEDQGICYMAMLYIHGETLKTRIRREGRISCDEALHIIQQVAEALHYAWTEAGLVHRDVKPDNIMLAEHGIVKLTDLGLAIKQAEWHEGMDISGSPSYMSPEQFAGEKLDTRSDIYSLGVTLYQMLTGQLPFDAKTIGSIARQHFEQVIPNVCKAEPSIPASVNKLLQKMLAKHRNKRFKDMDALLKEIWKIRQITSPNRSYVPDVHTISMRRLDYDIQNVYRDREDDSEITIPPRSGGGSGWFVFLSLLFVASLAATAYFYLKFRSADDALQKSAAFRLPERDALNFSTLVAETGRTDEELNTELARISGNIKKLTGDPERLQLLKEYLSNLIVLRELTQRLASVRQECDRLNETLVQTEEKAKSAAALSDEAQNRKYDELRAEYDQKIRALELENENLRANYGEVELRRKSFLDQIQTLDHEISRLNQELAAARDDAEKDKMFRKEFHDIVKAQLVENIFDSLRYRRFDVAEGKITEAGARFSELSDWLNKVSQLVNECKSLYGFFREDPNGALKGKVFAGGARVIDSVSGGMITYHLKDNPAISFKCNMTELTYDALLYLMGNIPVDSPAAQKIITSFEVIRGNYGAAETASPDNETLVGMVEIYAARSAERIINSYPSDAARKAYETFRKRFAGTQSYTRLEEKLKILFKEKTLE